MKRAFVITYGGTLVSTMVPDAALNSLIVGDRLTTSRLLDIAPSIQIGKGSEGTVAYIDKASGLVEVLMDTYHRGLAAWDNHLWLQPFDTEDLIDGIKCASCVISQIMRVA